MTTTHAHPDSLTGKLLIAMPGMGDPRFETAVVYLCAHSRDATMGLIVNKRADDLTLDDMLEQLEIPKGPGSAGIPVHFGGPVEVGRGFVLHSSDYEIPDATLEVDERFCMTASREILRDIATGAGPARRVLTLGYAGWGAGQLENEILANAWLTADADPDIVFGTPNEMKWEKALRSLGIEPLSLSGAAGHA